MKLTMPKIRITGIEIEIKLSFCICILLMIALKLTGQFFIIFFTVTFHESAHIFVAKKFGLKTERLVITPVGQRAIITGLETVPLYKEVIILLAGAAMNFLLAGLGFIYYNEINFLVAANLAIGLFNLLPVYPLDGGRIIHALLCQKTGVLRGNSITIAFSRLFAVIFMLVGLLQVVLYPFNVSILIIGCYVFKMCKKEKTFLLYNFNKLMFINRIKLEIKTPQEIKQIAISKKAPLNQLLKMLTWKSFHIFYITEDELLESKFSEHQLISYIIEYGAAGIAEDIIKTPTKP